MKTLEALWSMNEMYPAAKHITKADIYKTLGRTTKMTDTCRSEKGTHEGYQFRRELPDSVPSSNPVSCVMDSVVERVKE